MRISQTPVRVSNQAGSQGVVEKRRRQVAIRLVEMRGTRAGDELPGSSALWASPKKRATIELKGVGKKGGQSRGEEEECGEEE
ncbi:uncharacterized protein N7482_002961 [Penicillium canariense]|uniref:Uncharacterized protein n=1 Tax=Penicillium canariense TaxID=189055 RepID=A0A9W9IGE2_9EURO|nr:uncharacterized protein N7482_002961 [Penicillium canariense]KAJ5177084.1 hypothetical protein N7482_002961 [Penicillium canariense]